MVKYPRGRPPEAPGRSRPVSGGSPPSRSLSLGLPAFGGFSPFGAGYFLAPVPLPVPTSPSSAVALFSSSPFVTDAISHHPASARARRRPDPTQGPPPPVRYRLRPARPSYPIRSAIRSPTVLPPTPDR